jgi:pimeloyl-ACP methyl ester carboxylesterase
MSIKEGWVNNKGVNIHYLDSSNGMDHKAPLIICHGLSESAEDYIELMRHLAPRRCIALTFRGRGKSSCPEQGYSLEAHVSDIEAVINHLGLESFYLMGYSRGVSYTLGYATANYDKLKGLIIEEYPALHRKMYKGWAEEFLEAFPNTSLKRTAALGIELESEQVDFSSLLHRIKCPAMIMRGMRKSSLLTDEAVEVYLKNITDCRVVNFENAGHDIQTHEKDKFLNTISTFLSSLYDKKAYQ